MKNSHFGEFAIEYSLTVNDFLGKALARVENEEFREVMQYSALAPGKRLRPLLFLATLRELSQEILPEHIKVAGGIEVIHTYSLIHDDLPAMDNDDYRRGQLTSHKKFDEASAILAGDALLTVGINWILQAKLEPELVVQAARIFTQAIGPNGMVGGQYLDVHSTNAVVSEDVIQRLEYKKTAELIIAAVKMGAIFGHASEQATEQLVSFASNFGQAFQIYDDLIDVTETAQEAGKETQKDASAGKNNYVTRLGIAGAQAKLAELIEQMKVNLASFDDDILFGFTAIFMKVLENDQKKS